MKFLHMSDTHYLIRNRAEIYGIDYNPNDILEDFLKKHDFSVYDFIVHTGDLISDGHQEDYEAFFSLMKQYIPENLPIHYVLGNHDKRHDYLKAKQVKLSSDRYFYSTNKDGYRLIFLDTLIEGKHEGTLDDQQLKWLYKELANPFEKGTLIFLHHPLEIGWYSNDTEFIMPSDLKDKLTKSDVKAIFSGHIHMQRTSVISGIPQFTANSMAFGISLRKDTYWRNNRLGFSIVEIADQHIDYSHEIILPRVADFKEEERETFENFSNH